MTKVALVCTLSIAIAASIGCSMDDEERCGDQFRFVDGVCMPLQEDAGGAEDATVADATATDSLPSDAALPTGLGAVCDDHPACNGNEADYCSRQPGASVGYCTVQGCSTTADACPAGYRCCDFAVAGTPNFCATDADFSLLSGLNMCR